MVKMIVPETKFKGPKPSPALIYMNQSIDTGTWETWAGFA